MALNTYLTLKLGGVDVPGGVTQKGREGSILVSSLEWSFDSDGNVGELKFVSEVGKETPTIATGLKTSQVVDAEFKFWEPSSTGVEVQYFTLHGTAGAVTSVDIWMPNNIDPALQRVDNSVQYTMSFGTMQIIWMIPPVVTATIP